ncbi:MAG: hypothetical protein OEM38_02765 [Gammaproteobacteria bacterium]|nr:hypothetical protein [Gammaproteobacteria bacterium]
MGFMIDMVTGNVSNITNGVDLAIVESAPLIRAPKGDVELPPQEQLLPVSNDSSPDTYTIPGSIINCEIDLLIEKMK